jgi:hypothetical protein
VQVWLFFLSITILYAIASTASYSEKVRESGWMFTISWAVAIASSTIWVLLIRHLNETNKIIAASLVWDLIVTVVYALIPATIESKNLNWQAYAALGLAVVALLWFKMSTN